MHRCAAQYLKKEEKEVHYSIETQTGKNNGKSCSFDHEEM